jgi:dolichyl-phosphate beta-glucosyltransferase
MIDSLSIIFPIYNETRRIDYSLKIIKKFIKSSKFSYLQIIFVDDGSNDSTYYQVNNFITNFNSKKNIKLLLLKNLKNLGKGFSLKKGISKADGKWLLTSDIDLSVSLEHFRKWKLDLIKKKSCYVFFGSRNHPDSNVKKTFIRFFLGIFYRILIYFLFKIKFYDTQCGYKLFKTTIAKKLFYKLKDRRFAHDVEIILLANKYKISIKEMPVVWSHKKYSKLNIFIDTFIMFIDLLTIRKRYF